MAINTVNEKIALMEYWLPFYWGTPTSVDGIGQDDKQQLLWGYPGLLWTSIAFSRWRRRRNRTISAGKGR